MSFDSLWELALAFIVSQGAGVLSVAAIVWRINQAILQRFTSDIEQRLAERFGAQEQLRVDAGRHWDGRFDDFSVQLKRLENEQIALKLEVWRDFQRKEDSVRSDTVTQAKLDALNAKVELVAQLAARLDGTRS